MVVVYCGTTTNLQNLPVLYYLFKKIFSNSFYFANRKKCIISTVQQVDHQVSGNGGGNPTKIFIANQFKVSAFQVVSQ